jgi:GntR family transcriptional regulator, transcriptional repressor for pyruvate dehydrogenase complex
MMIFILINDALVKSMSMTLTIPGQPLKTLKDHRDIFEAICMRDSEKAALLMKEHIEKAKKNIIKSVEEEARF